MKSKRAGIYFRIFNRAKTPFSIVQKLEKGEYGFENTDKKLQDLIGLRVVVYYHDDMKIIRKILEETFCIEDEWSVTDTTEEEFKASKLNGVFRIPDEYMRTYNGDLDCIPADLTFEVQLRTISFEGWHEIEHDMRYKSPYSGEFWRGNEDLSRSLNCVLANLELCDWTTVTVFEKLSEYHYDEKNWEMMMKGKFRLRFELEPLAAELVEFLDEHPSVSYYLFRCTREQVIFSLLRDIQHTKITYNLIVKLANEAEVTYDSKTKRKLSKLCSSLVKEERMNRLERMELNQLERTPNFELNVVLSHKTGADIHLEFMAAIQMVASWAQSRLRNVINDIPSTPIDYEIHVPGYNVKILGDVSLGIYKLDLDYNLVHEFHNRLV